MELRPIINDNEYEKCVQEAHVIQSLDKIYFCPNFYYVFYGELEINLNRYFTQDSREQWSLLFVDYNFMPPNCFNENNLTSFQIFIFQPNVFTILYNAKVKYSCRYCLHEWTTARGRAIFQAELPEINKHNILFAYLFTQQCEKCHQEISPSWYLDETTRVMKNICRILKDKFYSNRQFRSLSFSSDDDDIQRSSDMKNSHHYDLCQACQQGSCYTS